SFNRSIFQALHLSTAPSFNGPIFQRPHLSIDRSFNRSISQLPHLSTAPSLNNPTFINPSFTQPLQTVSSPTKHRSIFRVLRICSPNARLPSAPTIEAPYRSTNSPHGTRGCPTDGYRRVRQGLGSANRPPLNGIHPSSRPLPESAVSRPHSTGSGSS